MRLPPTRLPEDRDRVQGVAEHVAQGRGGGPVRRAPPASQLSLEHPHVEARVVGHEHETSPGAGAAERLEVVEHGTEGTGPTDFPPRRGVPAPVAQEVERDASETFHSLRHPGDRRKDVL